MAPPDHWAIHDDRAAWPLRSGRTFIVAAYGKILDTMFGLDGEDLILDWVDTTGYRNAAISHFQDALMTGSMLASAEPLSGGEMRTITPAEWTRETVESAIGSGTLQRRLNRRPTPHWVYVDDAELALMRKVLEASDMLYDEREYGPVERLGGVILGNLVGIASRRGSDPAAEAEAVLKLFLPSGRYEFENDDDRDRFVAMAVRWLHRRFADDPDVRRTRDDFQADAADQFGGRMTGRMFDRVWRKTVAKPTKGADVHKARRTAGRRKSR